MTSIHHITKKRFELAKKFGDSTYHLSPLNDEYAAASHQGYRITMGRRTYSTQPFIFLHQTDDAAKPDAVPEGDEPIVACVGSFTIERRFKIMLGDPREHGLVDAGPKVETITDGDHLPWESIGMDSKQPTWSLDLPGGERRSFAWKNTRHAAVDGTTPSKLTYRGYKLVELEGEKESGSSGDVLAVFSCAKGLTNSGTLQINVDLGQAFEHMVILTLICVFERSKQPVNASGAGQGIGGVAGGLGGGVV
jgi:hypothetical protein